MMRNAFGPLAVAFCLLVGLSAAPADARRDAPDSRAVAKPTEPATKGATTPLARVVLNTVIGPPDSLSKQLRHELAAALGRRSFEVLLAGNSTRADYILRTYVLASQEKEHTKVAYVLANPAVDPWAAVSPELAKTVAAKAVGGFEEWLAKQGR